MRAISLAGLLIYTFGAFAYGALAVIWLGEWRRLRRTGEPASLAHSHEGQLVFGALIAVSVLWFVSNIALLLTRFARIPGLWPLDVAVICLAFAYPPIIMHTEYVETRAATPSIGRGWRFVLSASYVVALALPLWCVLVFTGSPSRALRVLAERSLGVGLSALFVGAAVYAIALGRKGAARTIREHQGRRWSMALFGVTILLFIAIPGLMLRTDVRQASLMFSGLVEVAAKSLPLVFFFVASYHENRFHFFDLFVKRGASLVVATAVLTGWFALLTPLLRRFDASPSAPWLYAIVLLPIAVSLPSMFARLGAVLDRRWLGRRFSTVEALTHFFGRLRSATSEAQLVQHAQAGLHEIFGAPAVVVIGEGGTSDFTAVQAIPIRSGDAVVGRLLMGPRDSEAPYFSEDLALLGSLADVLSHVIDNLRLQLREQAQERRARDLTLNASRSELKALRAQINPHFLFNALNSIAGLIHRQPAVADRTIEQLADVFRYALRGESEWAVLDDELEFVGAYLAVEQARFGPRLQTEITLADEVRGARLPTMIVQTLVENAVKHGVASVRGQAIVHLSARRDAGDLVVSVIDNGPGFPDGDASTPSRDGSGYGLANIRQRLDGYFGTGATLDVRRDVEGQQTIVSVSLPFLRQEPPPRDGRGQAEAEPGPIAEADDDRPSAANHRRERERALAGDEGRSPIAEANDDRPSAANHRREHERALAGDEGRSPIAEANDDRPSAANHRRERERALAGDEGRSPIAEANDDRPSAANHRREHERALAGDGGGPPSQSKKEQH